MAKKDKNIIRRRLVQSYLSSTVSISLVLFLVGVMILFGANAKSIANYFKENAVVSVILSGNATEEYALQLRDKIAAEPYVKSALYISKEQGEREMEELLGSDFLDVFEASPIPISIELNLNGEYVSKDSIAVVKDRLYQMSQVREVSYQESLIEMLNANLEKIGLVMAVIILLLLFISCVLIGNTVRLNVYARRFTIHTMRLVGATRNFIRKPFVRQAAIQGAVAGLIADIFLALGLFYFAKDFNKLYDIFTIESIVILLWLVVAVGMILCIISAWYVVGKIAYTSKDDLYY